MTYKTFTFDFRYYDTDLSKTECFALTGDLHGLNGGGGALGSPIGATRRSSSRPSSTSPAQI